MKKLMIWVLSFLLLASAAFAAAHTLKLSSDQPVEEQVQALKGYLDRLPEKDREQWALALRELSDDMPQETALAGGDDGVWVSGSGKRYHRLSTCSNMKNPVQVSREEALKRGLTPCSKCKPR